MKLISLRHSEKLEWSGRVKVSYGIYLIMDQAGYISSKHNGPNINYAVYPHPTVTFTKLKGICICANVFSVTYNIQFCVLTNL